MDAKEPTSLFCKQLVKSIEVLQQARKEAKIAEEGGLNEPGPGPTVAEATAAAKHNLWLVTHSPLNKSWPEQSRLVEAFSNRMQALRPKKTEGPQTEENGAKHAEAVKALYAEFVSEHLTAKTEANDDGEAGKES